jgi:hypothetical protein
MLINEIAFKIYRLVLAKAPTFVFMIRSLKGTAMK